MKSNRLKNILIVGMITILLSFSISYAQDDYGEASSITLYDIPPRWLVDMPTAGTLPRAYFDVGVRIFPEGGGLGYTNIGISDRITLGISYGGVDVVSNKNPDWNGRIGFNLKFRLVDELEFFPAVTFGFTDQGFGKWIAAEDRYTYKSRGFFGVASRSFYFYKWTAGWHAGFNKSLEGHDGSDKDFNIFGGFDATFDYNLAIAAEYDAALNDDRQSESPVSGKGRGYLNTSIKWLFADNLELSLVIKDILINRRESTTATREVRLTYIDRF